jgi:hypothetical protein
LTYRITPDLTIFCKSQLGSPEISLPVPGLAEIKGIV